jgi:hypothetical protein
MIPIFIRDANEPKPGFELEPKIRIFGKFSNPNPSSKILIILF